MGVLCALLCAGALGQGSGAEGASLPWSEGNILPLHPLVADWHGEFASNSGSYHFQEYQGYLTGPLIRDQLSFDLFASSLTSDGYVTKIGNTSDGYVTKAGYGAVIDYRNEQLWNAALTWTPSAEWEVRLVMAHESIRNGDGRLERLPELNQHPFLRDGRWFYNKQNGTLHRDALAGALELTYHGAIFDAVATTGARSLRSEQSTNPLYFPVVGLPYYPKHKEDRQALNEWSQQFLLANPREKPVRIAEHLSLRWEAGLFASEQSHAITSITESVGPGLPPDSSLWQTRVLNVQEKRVASWLRATATVWDRLDLTVGLSWDRRATVGALTLRYLPVTPLYLSPMTTAGAFVSEKWMPEAAIAYRLTPHTLGYLSYFESIQGGGYNRTLPFNYASAKSHSYVLGIRNDQSDHPLRYQLALFYTAIQQAQANVPRQLGIISNPMATVNVGDAHVTGVDIDLAYRVCPILTVFGSARWQNAQFDSGASANGVDRSGRSLPYMPEHRVVAGLQAGWQIDPGTRIYGVAGIEWIGAYHFDVANRFEQKAYSLANFRLGLEQQGWFIEAYADNVFDKVYLASAQPADVFLAPDGGEPRAYEYYGQAGAPFTAGIRVGIRF